uniref:Uncharacterized protein n=1 Tax=Nelumbo nucifera TaxID=4432 RepID=A0A822Z292_NELNU|nr:TPA_asm: hypothetical protein HUJ06_014867 [Nelumbo nucifera]
MGNCCLKPNKVPAWEEPHRRPLAESGKIPAESLESMKPNEGGVGVALMRFKTGNEVVSTEESNGDGKGGGGGVRFRIILTQQELNRILNYKKDSKCVSAEELLSLMKEKRRMVGARTDNRNESRGWRPTLEGMHPLDKLQAASPLL